MLVAFGQIAVGDSLAGVDVTLYSLPNRLQVTEAFRSLRLPQWDPFRFGGVPLLANPQAAVLYPVHLALAAVPAERAQGVSLVAHVLVLGAGAYVYARHCVRVAVPAGVLAAVATTLGGFANSHIGHYEQATAMAWVPWALIATDVVVDPPEGRTGRRAIPALAAAVALVALAGHTQYLHMTLALVATYATVAVVRVRAWARALHVVAGMALGLGLSAAQLVPTLLLAERSVRSGGLRLEEAGAIHLLPSQLVSTFASREWGRLSVEMWTWLPWTVLLLAAVALVVRLREWRIAALAIATAVGALLALGPSTPAYRLAFASIPGMDLFRVPSRWLLLPAIAVPLLAAAGGDAIARGVRPSRTSALVAAVMLAAFAAAAGATQEAGPTPTGVAVGAAIGAALVAGWVVAVRRPAMAPAVVAAVALVVVGESLEANRDAYVRWLRMEPEALFRRSATLDALGGSVDGRIISMGGEDLGDFAGVRRAERANAHVFDHLRSIDGYDGGLLVTRDWRAAMADLTGERGFPGVDTLRPALGLRPLDPVRFAELDITRAVARSTAYDPLHVLPPGSRLAAEAGDVRIYETPSLGPVFLADGTVPTGLRLRRDVERPERLLVDVPRAAVGRTVVVSEAFDPGWSASGGLRLGRHHDLLLSFTPTTAGPVELRYRTPGLVGGGAVSLACLAIAIALVVLPRRRRS